MADDVEWEPPGPGVWYVERAHFPLPVSGIFADLFPPITAGWRRGAVRWGRTPDTSTWGVANHWLYYSPGPGDAERAPDGPDIAAQAVRERWWREEVRRWHEEERPAVVATNLALQREPLEALDDHQLRDHVARCFDHYRAAAPLHFEHFGRRAVREALHEELAAAGLADLEDDLERLIAGASEASARPATVVAGIAEALVDDGVTPGELAHLDDVRTRSRRAAQRLDAYLDEFGWRLVESYDPVYPTLGERPDLVLASIRGAMAGGWRTGAVPLQGDDARPWHREGLPDDTVTRLDELLADARRAHGLRDDDDGTCFFWPMGLVRRALLEVGRRATADGRVADPAHVFDASSSELLALLDGDDGAPTAEALARRAAARVAAAALAPPPSLPVGASPAPWSVDGGAPLRGTPIGTGVGIGRARVHRTGDDVLDRIEPGDVLIAVTTTPAFNTVFPLLAAVAVEEGNLGAHAAVLGRELGVPVAVGVHGLLAAVPDGALVEVDGDTGIVRVLE